MANQRLSAPERRKQILQSAMRVFARHAYRGATTKMISQEAGIAEALIYRYFGSKQQLFSEAVDLSAGRLVDGVERCISECDDDPGKALASTLAYFRRTMDRHETFAKMVFVTAAELDEPWVRAVYLPHQERALSIMADAIEGWQGRGLIRADIPARAAAWLLVGSHQIMALMKCTGSLDDVDLDAVLRLSRPFLTSDHGS